MSQMPADGSERLRADQPGAIEAMGAEVLVQEMIEHRESYEHFGQVIMRIWDLNEAWETQRAKRRAAISYEDSWVAESIESSPPSKAGRFPATRFHAASGPLAWA